MRIALRSLFFKIFLWFWVTVIVTAVASVLTFVLNPGSTPSRWHVLLEQTARSFGTSVVSDYERSGKTGASSYLESVARDAGLRACLFEVSGSVLSGDDCLTFADVQSRVAVSQSSEFGLEKGLIRVALLLRGSTGHEYVFATELPAGPRAAIGITPATVMLRLSVAFVVSGLVCYWLASYLTGPIVRLREAAVRLAEGELDCRAHASVVRRRDELGALARDFNAMADRIQLSVSQQRELIFDISHELRSPMARLNVALDLARSGGAGDVPFSHMERDLAQLNEMLERILTIAKLDTASAHVELSAVDVTALVRRIVEDAAFEAQKRNITVNLSVFGEPLLQGNAQLLHSAIENVVRNAVHYTALSSSVEIMLRASDTSVLLNITDHGCGVPDSDLKAIFQPFRRVGEARARGTGGVGLGLAITDRVVRFHGGTIGAQNARTQGLTVTIELPVTFRSPR